MSKELRVKLEELKSKSEQLGAEIEAIEAQIIANRPKMATIDRLDSNLEPLTFDFVLSEDDNDFLELCGGDGVVIVEPRHLKLLAEYIATCLTYLEA